MHRNFSESNLAYRSVPAKIASALGIAKGN